MHVVNKILYNARQGIEGTNKKRASKDNNAVHKKNMKRCETRQLAKE